MPRARAISAIVCRLIAGRLLGLCLTLDDQRLEVGIRHSGLALVVDAEGVERGELALAGGVVHQRGDADAGVVLEGGEAFEHVRRRDLAAEVDEMLGAEPALPLAVLDRRGKRAHVGRLELGVVVHADAERIEDGGDPRRGDLGVMGLDRGDRVPADARARRVVALEVVGVELDQTGDQPVAVEVDAGMARDRDRRRRRSRRRGRRRRRRITSSGRTMRPLRKTVSVMAWLGYGSTVFGESLSDHQFAQLL